MPRPNGSVSIPISSNDVTEGTLTEMTVDFTVDNWSKPQTVTIQGVDDNDPDGDMMYSIVIGKPVTVDAHYSELDPDDVSLSNIDDEPPPQ